MKKNMKLISLIVVFVFAFTQITIVSAGVSTIDYSQMDRNEELVYYLVMLGIIDEEDASSFTHDETITRGEVADLTVRSHGQYDFARSFSFFTGFSDLRPNDPFADIVAYAVAVGILTGQPGGMLQFGEDATVLQAARMIIGALGYDARAQVNGGWPQGYLVTGTQIRLFNGMNVTQYNQPISRLDFAIMLYNAFSIPISRGVVFTPGTDGITFQTDVGLTLENQFLRNNDYVLVTGIVEATERTTIGSREQLRDNEVIIGGTRLNTGDMDLNDFIGYEIQYIARQASTDTIGTLVRFRVTRNNSVTHLTRSSFPTFRGDRVEFYDASTGRTRELRLDPNAIFIHNNRMLMTVTPEMIDFSDGVTLISNNLRSDRLVNVVRWTSSRSFVTGGISEPNEFIYLAGGATFNGSASVSMRESADRIVSVRTVDGEAVDWRDIEEGSAISIIESADRFYLEIILLPEPIVGRISEMHAGEWLIINYERFYVTSQLDNAELGVLGRFFVNENGYIFRFEPSMLDFVYIIDKSISGGFDSTIRIRTFDNHSGLSILEVDARVSIDGAVYREADTAFENIPVNTVANVVVAADGRVREITRATPYGGTARRTFRSYVNAFNDGLRQDAAGNEILGQLDVAFKFNPETLFFILPQNRYIEDFGISPNFEDGDSYTTQAYEFDLDTEYVGVVVVTIDTDELAGRFDDNSPIGIVSRVGQMLDRNDQPTFFIEGFSEGEPFRYTAAQIGSVISVMQTLRIGDVIRFNTNFNNQIVNIVRMESLSGLDPETDFYRIGDMSTNEMIFANAMMLRRSAIVNNERFLIHQLQVSTTTSFNDMVMVNIDALTVNTEDRNRQFNDYYIFDRFLNTVTPASINDVIPYNRSMTDSSVVFIVRNTRERTRMLVIIRD
ncbi:MAG: hypothetical protein FWE04_05790 [Oscillospiraceae bacterium]|nr:hypothetical protein [Oscillospiraceae bacterium]